MLSKVFLVDKIAFIDINILFYCMIYFSKLEQEDILVIKLLHVIFFSVPTQRTGYCGF